MYTNIGIYKVFRTLSQFSLENILKIDWLHYDYGRAESFRCSFSHAPTQTHKHGISFFPLAFFTIVIPCYQYHILCEWNVSISLHLGVSCKLLNLEISREKCGNLLILIKITWVNDNIVDLEVGFGGSLGIVQNYFQLWKCNIKTIHSGAPPKPICQNKLYLKILESIEGFSKVCRNTWE